MPSPKNDSPKPPEVTTDRFEIYRFFNGISTEGKKGIDQARTRLPLVKTFLLEHVACRDGRRPKLPTEIFPQLDAELWQIDDTFYGVRLPVDDGSNGKSRPATVGFLEQYDERFFAYYTSEHSDDAKKRWARWVQHPDLDATWFSSPFLQVLWNADVSTRGDDRFGKLVFRHESVFEMPDNFASEVTSDDDSEEDANQQSDVEDDRVEPERRKARFEMGDRIGRIKRSLEALQQNYDPLHVLYALRLPSRHSQGGHDLYQTGQVTNRTDSFEDHRNTVRYLYRLYKEVLEYTEDCAWPSAITEQPSQQPQIASGGAPLIVRFSEPLSVATFDRWVELAFRKRNRFKLWGEPIRLGPTAVHVYGADRHLWQPINLELTATGIVAILPRGTCGNTFHRLVANIQHYVCPKMDAWIGSTPFDQIVNKWPVNAESADES